MPPAERTIAAASCALPVAPHRAVVSGWVGIGSAALSMLRPPGLSAMRKSVAAIASAPEWSRRGAIARGMGRSYGDAAQRAGGVVLDTTALTAFEVDGESGFVRAQAGVT